MGQITFAELSVEARTEVIKEAVESTAWSLEKSEKELEFLRLRLEEQKAALGHGKWLPWIKETFGDDDGAIRKIQRFLKKPNTTLLTYLPEGEEPPIVPRAERKTGRVEVAEVGQTVVQSDHSADVNKMVDENAVNAEPKTNTKHTPATAKATEADRPAPQIVTPVIVEESAVFPERIFLSDFSVAEMLEYLKASADDAKKRAKELRRTADELDPPTEGKTPSRSQLVSMIPDDWAPELQKAAADWAEYKQARAKGERIQTARAWELALDKFTKQPMSVVVSKVNAAIEKSWKGWDHNTANQQSGGTIAGTGRIKPAAIDESAITWK